jgi:hypothetical protein
LQYYTHFLTFRKNRHRIWQIGIRLLIPAEQFPNKRCYITKVKVIKLFDRKDFNF